MDAGGVNESLSAIADASHPSRIAPVERDTAHFSPRPLQGCDEAPLALKSYHISCPAALKRERHLFHFSVEKSEAPARVSRAQIIPQRHREGKRNTCLPHWPLRYRAGPTAGSGHEAILSPCLPFSTLTSTSSGAVAGPDWQRRGLPREEIRRIKMSARPIRKCDCCGRATGTPSRSLWTTFTPTACATAHCSDSTKTCMMMLQRKLHC